MKLYNDPDPSRLSGKKIINNTRKAIRMVMFFYIVFVLTAFVTLLLMVIALRSIQP